MSYAEFLESKRVKDKDTGIAEPREINSMLFPFQADIVRWALKRGRACMFEDCGLGKTPQQLEWARHVAEHTGRPVLIVAPLAVSQQTIREGVKFGVQVEKLEADVFGPHVYITNYEQLNKADPAQFGGVVLDESSILKSFTGKYRNELIDNWGLVPFRLCCSATPAPNDFMELGSHAEFMGVMTSSEMLASFFINDPGHVGHYRLKGHASELFWKWMCTWSVMIRKPSDLGYEDGNFILPKLRIHDQVVRATNCTDTLFPMVAHTLQERIRARKDTVHDRVTRCAEIINAGEGQWLCWCNLNAESEMIAAMIEGAVQVRGSDTTTHKETALMDFAEGKIRVLVTKPKIAGFGMNFQICNQMVFVGLSDSYEQYYQAVRRCWRFGQSREVQCHIVTADTEGAVAANIKRKEADSERLADGMRDHMAYISKGIIHGDVGFTQAYITEDKMQKPTWGVK